MIRRVHYTELANWNPILSKNDDSTASHNDLQTAALFAIRDELRKLNALLHCHNFVAIPDILRSVKRNTAKKRKPRAVGKPKLRVVAR